MKEPNKDDERLSALLEGKVQGEQREELLAHLARNEDDYAVFASTGAVLRALEEEDARAAAAAGQDPPAAEAATEGVIPLRRPARGPWMPRRSLAIAASIAAIALVSTLTLRTRAYPGAQPVQLATRLNDSLPSGWTDNPPWPGTRGSENASESGDAVRAGVMLVQLAVAAQASDSAEIHLLASQLIPYENGRDGTALRRIAGSPGAPPESLKELIDQATDDLARALDRTPLEVGAWAEATRIAAARRNEGYFPDPAAAGMLRRAKRLAGDNERARAAVDRVGPALRTRGPPPFEELHQSLTALLREIAR